MPITDIARAWADNAVSLAAWVECRLVNRHDAWGGYPQTTRPARRLRGQVFLERGHIVRHFAEPRRENIIGLHSTSPDNLSRWGGVDIDWHGETSTSPELNLRAALAWYEKLAVGGFKPLLLDSNGSGGFHLLAIFREAVPTVRVFHFLKALVADHARHGMNVPPECFPKQPAVAPPGQPGEYGNWLRLFGKHHNRGHWSRAWDGSRWLEGGTAAEFTLGLTGDSPGLVPEPLPPRSPRRNLRVLHNPAPDALGRRIAAYLAKLPNLGEGQGRDAVAYHFAAFLARDLALADEIALAWLERWDRGNSPPKGTAALAEILRNAKQYGRNAVGSGLRPAVRGKHLILTASTGDVA
jgi:hypothetical protein